MLIITKSLIDVTQKLSTSEGTHSLGFFHFGVKIGAVTIRSVIVTKKVDPFILSVLVIRKISKCSRAQHFSEKRTISRPLFAATRYALVKFCKIIKYDLCFIVYSDQFQSTKRIYHYHLPISRHLVETTKQNVHE